jgi:hypothetical protein
MCKCNNDCLITYIHKNLCTFVENFYNINYEVELVYAACNEHREERQSLIPLDLVHYRFCLPSRARFVLVMKQLYQNNYPSTKKKRNYDLTQLFFPTSK